MRRVNGLTRGTVSLRWRPKGRSGGGVCEIWAYGGAQQGEAQWEEK